jgi:hypothetical protein
MQAGEGNFSPSSDPEKKGKKLKKVKVRVSLFFDGTYNNATNVSHRLLAEIFPDLDEVYQDNEGDASYEGDFTNVIKLERNIDTSNGSPGYDYTLAVYTEGPGTSNSEGDDWFQGSAFGAGSNGIIAKVGKGIEEAVNEIVDKVKDKSTLIELLSIDVFGFSRGAAAARNCIYEVGANGETPIIERLVENGYKVSKVEVCFAGLFDTVSAYNLGVVTDSSDVAALKLNAVANAKKVVQLAAADEHRKKFSLTDITSVGQENGLQLFLPGVHADIGGGYREPVAGEPSENKLLIYRTSISDDANSEKNRLINAGWYDNKNIELKKRYAHRGRHIYTIKVTRNISNEYSKIPLHLMAKYASEKESGVAIKNKLYVDEKIPAKLKSVENKIKSYIQQIGSNSKPDHWIGPENTNCYKDWQGNDKWLRDLRHDYLHFSAVFLSVAHAPRIEGGQRVRKIYRG